jgi:hypothetical protein
VGAEGGASIDVNAIEHKKSKTKEPTKYRNTKLISII